MVFHGTTTANIACYMARNGPILSGTSDGVDSLEKFRAHPLSNFYTQTPEGPSLDTKALAKKHGVHAHVNQLEFLSKLSTDGKTRNSEEFHLIKLDHAQFPDGIANILRENMRWLGDKSCGPSADSELSSETRKAIERFEKILKYFPSERDGAL